MSLDIPEPMAMTYDDLPKRGLGFKYLKILLWTPQPLKGQ